MTCDRCARNYCVSASPQDVITLGAEARRRRRHSQMPQTSSSVVHVQLATPCQFFIATFMREELLMYAAFVPRTGNTPAKKPKRVAGFAVGLLRKKHSSLFLLLTPYYSTVELHSPSPNTPRHVSVRASTTHAINVCAWYRVLRGLSAAPTMLKQPLLDDEPKEDGFMYVRLVATVMSVSLGSSLQFGFATGSLNNLEQVRTTLSIWR